ncbi:anti-CRISPR protein AcrF3 (plasmid) [Pseudomonas aeruginosa]|uniref:anti-CRISPR protein AcrF3 n=1 Tax=Pseudomonas aeruginosa TaxID=287 RepID=UPI00070DDB6C|nr:anti-CRISPR protein AcrF3 [Pseudomonas aeruginosa]EIU3553138.1 anti-CRISPR protein AcrF3 [Pseudomonas aeruginosa]UGR47991.1 anti-CRISPR protein AcrF3 [Pseudomonas aeruginosa]HBO6137058.1 anti-CRISPR protein AcrF3 [Pseudomonas aeruginosa]
MSTISDRIVAHSVIDAARFIDEWQEADLDHLTESQIRAAVAFAVRLHEGFQESVLQRLVNESCHDEYLEYKGWEEALLNADGRVASSPFADWGWWYRIANVMLATASQNVGVTWGSRVHGRLMAIFQDKFKQRYED